MDKSKIDNAVEFREVRPKDLTLLEVNARYMSHEQFERLVSNVKRDGILTSTPLCYLERDADGNVVKHKDGRDKLTVLSGNHRTLASIDAELETISVMVITVPLTEDRQKSIQLSHNAVQGQDDPATLAALYESITSIDEKAYTGLDDSELNLLMDLDIMSIGESGMTLQTVTLLFFPNELEEAKAIWDVAEKVLSKVDELWVAKMEQYDAWMDEVAMTSRATHVRNIAATLRLILASFMKHRNEVLDPYWLDLASGEEKNTGDKFPIDMLYRNARFPSRVLAKLRRATDKLVQAGHVPKDKQIQAIEWIVDEFLELPHLSADDRAKLRKEKREGKKSKGKKSKGKKSKGKEQVDSAENGTPTTNSED